MADTDKADALHGIYFEQADFEISSPDHLARAQASKTSNILTQDNKPWERFGITWMDGLDDREKCETFEAFFRLPIGHSTLKAVDYYNARLTPEQKAMVSFRCKNGCWSCQIREPGLSLEHMYTYGTEMSDWLVVDPDRYMFILIAEGLQGYVDLHQSRDTALILAHLKQLEDQGIFCQEIPPRISGEEKPFHTFHFTGEGATKFAQEKLCPQKMDLARGILGGSKKFAAQDYQNLLGLTQSSYTHQEGESRGTLATDFGDSKAIYVRTQRGIMMLTPRVKVPYNHPGIHVFEPNDNKRGAQLLIRDVQ